MCEWPAGCSLINALDVQAPGAREVMRVHISTICVVFVLAAGLVAAQSSQDAQSNQRDTPSAALPGPSTTATTPPRPEPTTATAPRTEPTPIQLPPIGRSGSETAAVPTQPNGPSQCPGNPRSSASSASSSSFPGVGASQLPRAGVSADAFERPGVSAAQLAALQPGARSAPCAPPRDVILYPDVARPSRRVPPPGENQP
jgi:hypothetical protein